MTIARALERVAALYSFENPLGLPLRIVTIVAVTVLLASQGKRVVWYIFSDTLERRQLVSPGRARTMQALLSSLWAFLCYSVALLVILGLFVPATGLLTALGLFSAAFGLGARPLVSDYLTGVTLIFEYPFAVGDKVELNDIQGTVEAVDLRTTKLRSVTGELYVIPNGDIRIIRNFSRGAFSVASIHVTVPARELDRALPILEDLVREVYASLGDQLIEVPKVISESGELGATTTLTIVAHARFGQGATLRRHLLEMVHERLEAAGIAELA